MLQNAGMLLFLEIGAQKGVMKKFVRWWNAYRAWMAKDGREDGFNYAMAELAKDPGAGPRLASEAQDMFDMKGRYPFNEGIFDAIKKFHGEVELAPTKSSNAIPDALPGHIPQTN